ncbi:hypothetical protein [Microbacterium sp. Marseille-Q6648]|uniref:hypothetical protein n=1 Tax=Microbacterium sp. Marseille-Q6648 TaxID=2937991 RepID=UPI00203B3ABF|nr:hypothetical protein [Microbacterium sp. Marseille-Q6648]
MECVDCARSVLSQAIGLTSRKAMSISIIEFDSGVADLFDAYFGLKEDLEALFGRRVDPVMADAVRNPFFQADATADAEELYAA